MLQFDPSYRTYNTVDQYHYRLPGAQHKIALISDWGTGNDTAKGMLQSIFNVRRHLQPDVLIHLGDVYYAGTEWQQRTYWHDMIETYVPKHVQCYALMGNHDMYASGGKGFFSIVDDLRENGRTLQEASYFSLNTDHFQLLSMDTGRHDRDCTTIGTKQTVLEESEVEWLQHAVRNQKHKKTVLLSHHQLFTSTDYVGQAPDGKYYPVNVSLYRQVESILQHVPVWIWGHDHNFIVYEPYRTCKGGPRVNGRCIGAGSVPVYINQNVYDEKDDYELTKDWPRPAMTKHRLGVSQGVGQGIFGGGRYNVCYAVVTIDGPDATIDYFELPPLWKRGMSPPKVILSETL